MKNLTPPLTNWATWFDQRGCHVGYWRAKEGEEQPQLDHTKADMICSLNPLQALSLSQMLATVAFKGLAHGMPADLIPKAPEPYPADGHLLPEYTLDPPRQAAAGIPDEAQKEFESWLNQYWSSPSSEHETTTDDSSRLQQRTRRKAKPRQTALRRLFRGN